MWDVVRVLHGTFEPYAQRVCTRRGPSGKRQCTMKMLYCIVQLKRQNALSTTREPRKPLNTMCKMAISMVKKDDVPIGDRWSIWISFFVRNFSNKIYIFCLKMVSGWIEKRGRKLNLILKKIAIKGLHFLIWQNRLFFAMSENKKVFKKVVKHRVKSLPFSQPWMNGFYASCTVKSTEVYSVNNDHKDVQQLF